MKNLMSKVQNFIQDESGPTAVEYAVMLALIIVVCIAGAGLVGTAANQRFTDIATTIGSTPN